MGRPSVPADAGRHVRDQPARPTDRAGGPRAPRGVLNLFPRDHDPFERSRAIPDPTAPSRVSLIAGQSAPLSQGPVIANVIPGPWMFTNSHSLWKVAPANPEARWSPLKTRPDGRVTGPVAVKFTLL